MAKSQMLPIKVTLCDISASQIRCSAFLWRFARARTWIADSMIRLDQVPVAPATGDSPSMLSLDNGPQPKDGAGDRAANRDRQ
jgi:hypothetical protein